MTKQLEGKKAPNFKGSCTSNKEIKLSDFKGENLVLYFYPKDSTPGCTTEGQNFRDLYKKFKKNKKFLNIKEIINSNYHINPEKILKNEKGLRLLIPFSSFVLTKAMGLGVIVDVKSLYKSLLFNEFTSISIVIILFDN